ncbi:MAG: ABC transporter ATP-binding protein [Planctomycetota bacterium]
MFRYSGSGETLLRIPSFELAAGGQALLTGGSGTGKSTLLHLILGLMEPSSGEIRVAGRAIHKLHGEARDRFRGRHVGMVFQTFQLLHGFSALENVMLAMTFSDIKPGEHEERARELLDRLGIERTGAPPEALSVGQQQRVAVARALACGPELVLADEPTASLDPENGRAAVGLLREVCRERGAALLCVSHDPTLAGEFDEVHGLASLSVAEGARV